MKWIQCSTLMQPEPINTQSDVHIHNIPASLMQWDIFIAPVSPDKVRSMLTLATPAVGRNRNAFILHRQQSCLDLVSSIYFPYLLINMETSVVNIHWNKKILNYHWNNLKLMTVIIDNGSWKILWIVKQTPAKKIQENYWFALTKYNLTPDLIGLVLTFLG